MRAAAPSASEITIFSEVQQCQLPPTQWNTTSPRLASNGRGTGKRALKFRDWGKVAATFVDVSAGRAYRIAARESSKALARSLHPEIENKNQQQMLAYREMADDDLFDVQAVTVELPPEEFPGYKGERAVCARCGEGINFRREVVRDNQVLCRACAGEAYYRPA